MDSRNENVFILSMRFMLLLTIWVLDFVFQARAKHDTTNTVVAGCVTGGAISAKGKCFCFS